MRNTLLLLALFFSTDRAILDLDPTPSVVRYMIYLTVVAAFLHKSIILIPHTILTVLLICGYVSLTLLNTQHLSTTQLIHDGQLAILLFTLLCTRTKGGFGLDLSFLYLVIVAYLVSELVNFFLFRQQWYGTYLSFDTTKYLIAFPSLYALATRRTGVALALIGLTIPVLIGYVTRTLFLSYFAGLVGISLLTGRRRGMRPIYLGGSIAVACMLALYSADYTQVFEGYKALNMLLIIQHQGFSSLQQLDPVRFAESQMFFQLPPLQVIFGRGFGSGISDASGALAFVTFDQSAFSRQEIETGYFYSFHDFWVDIGLRYGLLPLLVFITWFFLQKRGLSGENKTLWVLSFVGIVSAFYGIEGLLATALLMRAVINRPRNASVQPC
ncbi:hypothetical protein [Oceanicola granulosus]|uniref:hypothetical protein n=1 Tax=Oceanicola granulosus TaxID=252302 RepID=UPI0012EA2A8A|nr:hypothetical protein [Oceanicola granulosus]